MLEAYAFSAGRVLPGDGFGSDLVADYQTGACFHAAFNVVVQLVLPCVDLGGANVEAWLLLTLLAKLRVNCDERFGILGKAH